MQNKKRTKFNLNLVKFQLALSQFAKTLSDPCLYTNVLTDT